MATSSPATVKGITYKTEVTPTPDGGLRTITLKSSTPTGTFTPVTSTIIDKTGKAGSQIFDPGASTADKAAFSNPTSEESKSRNNQVGSTKPFGNNPNADQQKVFNGAKATPNAATTADDAAASAAAAAEAVSTKKGTRTSYGGNMKYPLSLSLSQDVIKFSILEYVPSLQGAPGRERIVTLEGGSPIVVGSKRIGVITLPIPAGISDSNPVGWENDTLNMIQKAAAEVAKGYFEGGVDGGGKQLDNVGKQAQETIKTGEAKTAATGFLIGEAMQKNIAARAYGAINNNNVELLFSGPSLRSFSFTFLFYPREPNEAIEVRRIIRAFKQAMSVKRSATSLLLKSPHTFAISYMTVGQGQHPYLNRFKECALTSCSVEYTPDGTYMTYDGPEKSMTAYRLSLSFQELEPIFDDEYGPEGNIGF